MFCFLSFRNRHRHRPGTSHKTETESVRGGCATAQKYVFSSSSDNRWWGACIKHGIMVAIRRNGVRLRHYERRCCSCLRS